VTETYGEPAHACEECGTIYASVMAARMCCPDREDQRDPHVD